MNKRLGFFSLLLAAISYGSFGVWIRLLNQEMTIYQQIVFRNVIAFVLAIFIIILGKKYRINFKNISKKNLALYALVIPLSVIFYNIGILNLKIAVATFAFYMSSILFSELIGLFIYKVELMVADIVSLILVVVGLIFFVFPFSFNAINIGFWACLISGFFDAAANGFRKDLAGKLDKFVLISLTAVGGILVSGIMMTSFHQSLSFFSNLSPFSWFIGIVFGILLMLVNYLLLIGFQNFELGPGVITLSAELFFALIFGLLFFREFPTTKELIGGMCILAATIIPNINWLRVKQALIPQSIS